jgi:hypothetical protein
LADVVRFEAGHVDPFRLPGVQGPDPVQRAGALDVAVAHGDDHQQRIGRRRVEHVAQQQERRALGPLEVVEHQQDRAAGGDGA